MELKEKMSFEQAMEALERIAKRLSGGGMPLEEMLTLYEEGIALSKYCTSRLDDYEGRIERITAQGIGGEE